MSMTLKVLPDEHQRLWRSVCEHARQPILDLVRWIPSNAILVIVAPALSRQAWTLIERHPEQVPYWGDGPDDAIVAVLGTTGVGDDPEDLEDPLLGYLARVPEGQFGLLVFGPDGRAVVGGCVMPPGAAPENLHEGLNNGEPAS